MQSLPKRRYDFSECRRTARYVKTHFPDITPAAAHCYFLALPYLEQARGTKCGGWVVAPYDAWAQAAYHTKVTVMRALRELRDKGLIELVPGDARLKLATKIRRRTIEEIKTMVPRDVLGRFVPGRAEDLAVRLEKIGSYWGGKPVFPRFVVRKTGRIYMLAPNLQVKSSDDRWRNLVGSLDSNEVLVCSDYSQAEPTILLEALRRAHLFDKCPQRADIYNDLASIRGIPRTQAKKELLRLFYSRFSKVSIPETWKIPCGHYLHRAADAVNQYRNSLWRGGAPTGTEPRHVHTLLGRKIRAEPRERVHRGKILSWHIQGTLADIFNNALREVLERHDAGALRFLLQVFDSVYVEVKRGGEEEVGKLLEVAAAKAGIGIKTQTRTSMEREGGKDDNNGNNGSVLYPTAAATAV